MSVTKRDKYPEHIYLDYPPFNGWSVIMRGHGLTPAQVDEQVKAFDPGLVATGVTEEEYFGYMPRVKNCGDRLGTNCDNDGEWHGHWYALKANDDPDTHFTLAAYAYAEDEKEDQ